MEKNMAVSELPLPWKLTDTIESGFLFKPPETPVDPMEFLSRSWNVSALQLSSSLGSNSNLILSNPTISGLLSGAGTILDDGVGESVVDDSKVPVEVCGNPFSFESTQVIVDRIMSQSQEASPRNSARSSHSSGVMVGGSSSSSSLPGSPPISPSELDRFKNFHLNIAPSSQHRATASSTLLPVTASGSGKTVGRWLKDRREKKKEEIRAQNAQLHSAVSVAGVAAAVAAIAAASASSSIKDQELARTHMALASAATLVAAQCVEAAESMGAERDHLTSVVSSAVNVRSADNIMTLTAAAATALRGAATVKARALKEGSNIAAALPMEKGMASNNSSHSDELVIENFRGISSKKLLARGCELLKRTRKGELHWKIVCLYINRMNQVTLKMKSRHVAGTITKKKKYIVLEVVKNMPAWAGRYLLEGGENRRYFGFKTADRGLIEFECRNQREYEAWTGGVSRLLTLAAERSNMARM